MRTWLAALAALLLGACIKDPGTGPPFEPQCVVSSDCDDGEVCDDGICYGVPAVPFAVELYPPDGNDDLARSEIPAVSVAAEGNLENVAFVAAVEVSGRVTLRNQPTLSVAARLVFVRRSRIPGAPDYVARTVSIAEKSGIDASYHVLLPPTEADEVYEVSVIPDDGTLFTPSEGLPPAASVPPLRTTLAVPGGGVQDYILGDEDGIKQIRGLIVDAAGRGVAGLVVRAYGRFLVDSPRELASSIGVTDADGAFKVFVPVSWQDDFDLEGVPAAGVRTPRFETHGVHVEDPPPGYSITAQIPDVRLPIYPAPAHYQLPVHGPSAAGGDEASIGAKVVVETVLLDTLASRVVYATESTVGAEGTADLWLIPGGLEGNRRYVISVVPSSSATHAGVWSSAIDVGPPNPVSGDGGVLGAIDLPGRSYLTGAVYAYDGTPAEGVTVQATPAPEYWFSLEPGQRDAVEQLTWPTTLTDPEGRFVIALDPMILGIDTKYDLELIPPAGSLLPRWSYENYDPVAYAGSDGPYNIILPDATNVRGIVTDPQGEPVPGAEVRVYMVDSDVSVCRSIVEPCVPPARLRGLTRADDYGRVLLVLPEP